MHQPAWAGPVLASSQELVAGSFYQNLLTLPYLRLRNKNESRR